MSIFVSAAARLPARSARGAKEEGARAGAPSLPTAAGANAADEARAPASAVARSAVWLIHRGHHEYLYWNFTVKARRGTLLFALDDRSPATPPI
jgi:hypothetical protein